MFYKEFLRLRSTTIGLIAVLVAGIVGKILGMTIPNMNTSYTVTDLLIGGGLAGAIAATISGKGNKYVL